MYISHCSLLLSPWLPCVHEYLSTLYSRKKCQWILSCSPKLKSANIRTKLTKFCWSAACCSPWGCKESDTTKRLNWTEELLMWDLSEASGLHSFAEETCRFATVGSWKSTFGSCFWIYLQDPSLPAWHCSLPFSFLSNLCTSVSSAFSASPVCLLPQPQTSQAAVSFEVISFHRPVSFPQAPSTRSDTQLVGWSGSWDELFDLWLEEGKIV